MKTALMAAAMTLGFSAPVFADSTFDVADQVCRAWLASGAITRCSYGFDRGHYHIAATINADAHTTFTLPKASITVIRGRATGLR